MWKPAILIFLGGGLGSLSRFVLANKLNTELPYGTFLANILGCLLIGIFIALFEKEIFSNSLYLFLTIGFCGGFTTFSSFAAENFKMITQGNIIHFLAYLFLSFMVGVFMIYVGVKIVKLLN